MSSFTHAQNLGEYVYAFPNQVLKTNDSFKNIETLQSSLKSNFEAYENIDFEMMHFNESLASKNYTFQVYYQNIPVEQVWVKIHLQKKTNRLLLFQSNIVDAAIWNNFYLDENISTNENTVLLVQDERLILAEKIKIEEAKTDYYAQQFQLNDGTYFENILKYHNDTTAHVKVFLPNPISSANETYGGNYQDAYTKDTTALLIQNINNSGASTITTPDTNYTFDGQNFNVNASSYTNSFSTNNLFHVFQNIYLDGQGNVLGYNATITDNLSTFTSQIIQEDYNYPELAAEQVWKTMPVDYSSGEFILENDYFIISEFSDPVTNPATSLIDSFNFTRNQIEFEDANTFFHLNNYKAYWESLGFTNLANEVVLVDAHGNNGADNSYFSPTSPPKLIFGQGGVDDAEDADVIIHEYGHAISNFASPNSNIATMRKALDEGFGDYLATSYSRQYSTYNWYNIFSWDGHNEFWAGRITNSTKTSYEINSNQNIYYNGEIWASTLMDLYFRIGAENTDKIVIEAMHYNMTNTTIPQAALNLFVADTAIFNGQYSCDIFDVLEARKFVTGNCQDYVTTSINNYNENEGGVVLLNTANFTSGNGNIVIEINENDFTEAKYQIIDMNGAVLVEDTFITKQKELKNIKLSSGIYFLRVETNNYLYSFKILKN